MKRYTDKKKRPSIKSRLRACQWNGYRCLVVVIAALLYPTLTSSNPQGGKVVAGSAVITQKSAGRLDIVQSSDKAVIDWRSFSIGSSEHTHFQQPSVSSAALNRVRGGQSSLINGLLTANGRILLINPNGVLFGKSSRVNVGSLMATTTDISNENFMAGHYVFDNPSDNLQASVTNLGQIEVNDGGAVVLSAPHVANEGLIKARLGHVVLAAGDTFTVDFNGDGLLQFDLGGAVGGEWTGSENETAKAPVSNMGAIMADGGVVEMTAQVADALVERVINMEGIVQARAVDIEGGTIILWGGDRGVVAVSGTLDVSGKETGQVGGEVKVLGDKVGLFEGAEIDASGDAGGGQVLVGGNFQGNGPEPNARRTFVAETASIKADALTQGDGGEVIVWSDEITRFNGTISAKGGASGGDGGFVEVSGKQNLGFDGIVSVNAEQGEAGTVLLDPRDIFIEDGDSNDDAEIDDDGIIRFDDGDDGDGGFSDFFISSGALGDFEGNIVLQALQDIFINSSLNLSNQTNGESVVFQAGRDIEVNAGITTQGADLHLEADSPHSTVGAADGFGSLTVNAPLSTDDPLSNNDGAITLIHSQSLTITAPIDAGSGTINHAFAQDGGAPIIQNLGFFDQLRTTGIVNDGRATTAGIDGSGTGAQTLTFDTNTLGVALELGDEFAGELHLITNDGFTFNASLIANQPVIVNANADGDADGAIVVNFNTLFETNGNDLTLIAGSTLTSNAKFTTNGGDIALTASGNIATTDIDSSASLGGGSISLTSDTGVINVQKLDSSATEGTGGGITINAAGGIFTGVLTSDGLSGGGSISLTSNTGIDGNGFVSVFDIDSSSVEGIGGGITINAARNIFTGDLSSNGPLGGGEINLMSTNGVIQLIEGGSSSAFLGMINTSSTNGAAGNVNLTAPTFIEVGGIDSTGSTGTGNIALTSDEIFLLGGASSVQSRGALTLQPFSPDQAIIIGAEVAGIGALEIGTTELDALADGFNSITIGRDNGQHAITIIDADFTDPVTVQTPLGGSIAVGSFDDDEVGLRGQDNASVTLIGSGGTTILNADIVTSGQPIIIDDSVLVGVPNVRLDTTDDAAGAPITIEGTTDSTDSSSGETNSLTLTAGTGTVTLGDAGATTALAALGIDADSVSLTNNNDIDVLAANITGGGFTFTDSDDLTVGTVTDGNTTIDGVSADNVTLTTQNSGNLTLSGPVTGTRVILDAAGILVGSGNGAVSATNLGIRAASSLLTLPGDVDTLAAELGSGDFIFTDSDDLTVGTVTDGITTIDGVSADNVTLTTQNGGNLTLSSPVAGTRVILDAAGTLAGSGAVTATSLGASADLIDLQDVTTSGNQDYTGAVFLGGTYSTGGGNFTVNGDSLLQSNTTMTTTDGDINFNGQVNGNSALTLLAGDSGNILFGEDVGVATPLGSVSIESANNVRFNGNFNARDTRVNYVGDFTSVEDSLDITSLFVDPEADSAELFGSVAGAQGDAAATVVQGPVGDADFTINGCVIGVPCFEPPLPPPPLDPLLPTEAEPDSTIGTQIAKASQTPEESSILLMSVRRRPSNNPTVYQYSNLGNDELWDNYPGGASVSDFAAFTNRSTSDKRKKELAEEREKVE